MVMFVYVDRVPLPVSQHDGLAAAAAAAAAATTLTIQVYSIFLPAREQLFF